MGAKKPTPPPPRTYPARIHDLQGLPTGIYRGTWGGYVVKVEHAGVKYELETDVGVRCPSCPVVVFAKGGCGGVVDHAEKPTSPPPPPRKNDR